MATKRTLLALLLLAPSAAVIGQQVRQEPPQSTSTIFSTHRGDGDGNLWLRWNPSEQKAYLRGYLDGYHSGHDDGCEAADDFLAPPNSEAIRKDPARHCNNAESRWYDSEQIYADQISDFYSRYPAERDVPLPVMLWALSSQNGWSVDKIHDWHIARAKQASQRPSVPKNE